MSKKMILMLSLVLSSTFSLVSAGLPKDYGQKVSVPQTTPAPQPLPKDHGQ